MDVTAKHKTCDFLFHNYPVDLSKMHSSTLIEELEDNDLPYGNSHMQQWNFDGIRILYTRHKYYDSYLFKNKNESNVVNLEFNIKGRYAIHHFGQTYNVLNHQHNIIYSPGIDNTFENIDLHTETFKIEFTPEFFLNIIKDSNDILKRFADRMLLYKPVVLSPSSGIIDVQLLHAINEIIHCQYTGGIKKTFLLSKCLEILVLQAESFAHTENPRHIYTRRKEDLEKLEFARKYLIDNVDLPPSLKDLAKKAGINEYKLKRGFKEVYNSTVFGYLADFRMNAAKQKLEAGTQSIAEIAYELGYSSPQHFSKAFREKFGLAPKSVRKS